MTPSSIHSMHSHSGGPPGTIAIHSWDFCALTSPATSAGPCCLVIHSRGSYCRFFRFPRTLDISSRGFWLILTPTDFGFVQFTLRLACCPLNWTPTDFCSHWFSFKLYFSLDNSCASASIHSRGFLSARLDSHGLSICSFRSSHGLASTDSLLSFVDSLFTWSCADCIDYHGLLIQPPSVVCLPASTGLPIHAALVLLCSCDTNWLICA
jgi:hypothetical protein